MSSMPAPLSTITTLGLTKLEQIFDEIVKTTWEDCVEEDTPEEKTRKLEEKNYNSRVLTHIRDAI